MHDRRGDGPRRVVQRQLPLHRRRARLPLRRRGRNGRRLPRRLRAHPRGRTGPARRAVRSCSRWPTRAATPCSRVRSTTRRRSRAPPRRRRTWPSRADDLYVLYTGGTTGYPKGTLWRQSDIFDTTLGTLVAAGGDRHLQRSRPSRRASVRAQERRALPAPPLMHGAGQWIALGMHARRRHGRLPRRGHHLRPGVDPGGDRAGAGQPARDRGRRVRAAPLRRAGAPPRRRELARRDHQRWGCDQRRHQGQAPRAPAGHTDHRLGRSLGDRPPAEQRQRQRRRADERVVPSERRHLRPRRGAGRGPRRRATTGSDGWPTTGRSRSATSATRPRASATFPVGGGAAHGDPRRPGPAARATG